MNMTKKVFLKNNKPLFRNQQWIKVIGEISNWVLGKIENTFLFCFFRLSVSLCFSFLVFKMKWPQIEYLEGYFQHSTFLTFPFTVKKRKNAAYPLEI